jgi:LysM repeat protein
MGMVQFAPVKPGEAPVLALMDNDLPQVIQSYGWSEVARQRRKATTEWEGEGLRTMDVAVILDGYANDGLLTGPDGSPLRDDAGGTITVASAWGALKQMAVKPKGAATPGEIRVTGNLPGTSTRWVISALVPGNARMSGTTLVRQYATVSLMEFNPAVVLVTKKKPGTTTRTHTCKKGDTLHKLAAKYYKDQRQWRLIGNAQSPPIRDARKKLTPGRKLKIP